MTARDAMLFAVPIFIGVGVAQFNGLQGFDRAAVMAAAGICGVVLVRLLGTKR